MSNPVAGTDYTVNMTTYDEDGTTLIDLTGATVTIEYRDPTRELTVDVSPTSVDTTNSIVTWTMTDTLTTGKEGLWIIGGKIILASGAVRRINPGVKVRFDENCRQ
jgi:hypothetical protein